MKVRTLLLLLPVFLGSIAYPAASEPSVPILPFAAVLGYPSVDSAKMMQESLNKEWVGKTRDEMCVCLNQIIQRRGSMGAVKNGKQSMLSLRSGSAVFRIRISYDESARVSSVTCVFEGK
jgi:hypothetical protein